MTKSAWVLVGIGAVLVVGGGVIGARQLLRNTAQPSSLAAVTQTTGTPTTSQSSSSQSNNVTWDFTGTEYRASGTPPICLSPLLSRIPVDLAKVTGILYPGQTRGGNYKPHGGFRFDGATTNDVVVTAPFDAQLVNGARYLVDGEIQYTFDFVSACGLKYRIGHLLKLTPIFLAIADQFPPAQEMDSRTTNVEPTRLVTAGTEIATAVGITKGTNVFVDWGVYDLRTKNRVSADSAWQADHSDDQSLAPYAICWLEALPADITAKLKALPPGDPTSGTTSDYCGK